jgi:hypothetical protein
LQIGHELKQFVQLIDPENCINPNTHIDKSQLPGPLKPHQRQLLAQGRQYPPVYGDEVAAEYLGAHEMEKLRFVERQIAALGSIQARQLFPTRT